MRFFTRLGILALAGYGAWKLMEVYGPRAQHLQGPMQEFSDRAMSATRRAADDIGTAADRAAGAAKDAGAEIGRAARDASDDATRTMSPQRSWG
jgi:hypothetical protein